MTSCRNFCLWRTTLHKPHQLIRAKRKTTSDLKAYRSLFNIRGKGGLQSCHTKLRRRLNDIINLVRFPVSDRRSDSRRSSQYLISCHPTSTDQRNKSLGKHRFQNIRQLKSYLALLLLGKNINDSVNSLGSRVCVQCRKDKMACLSNSQSGSNRLKIAHFADQNNVRVFAKRGP